MAHLGEMSARPAPEMQGLLDTVRFRREGTQARFPDADDQISRELEVLETAFVPFVLGVLETMLLPVVFDDDRVLAILHVGPAEEQTTVVVHRFVQHRLRKPGAHQSQTNEGFGPRFRPIAHCPECDPSACDATPAEASVHTFGEVDEVEIRSFRRRCPTSRSQHEMVSGGDEIVQTEQLTTRPT